MSPRSERRPSPLPTLPYFPHPPLPPSTILISSNIILIIDNDNGMRREELSIIQHMSLQQRLQFLHLLSMQFHHPLQLFLLQVVLWTTTLGLLPWFRPPTRRYTSSNTTTSGGLLFDLVDPDDDALWAPCVPWWGERCYGRGKDGSVE